MRSILLNHDFGCLDGSDNGIALLKFKFVSAAARDGPFDEVVPNTNSDMGHDVAELNLFDFSVQFVTS